MGCSSPQPLRCSAASVVGSIHPLIFPSDFCLMFQHLFISSLPSCPHPRLSSGGGGCVGSGSPHPLDSAGVVSMETEMDELLPINPRDNESSITTFATSVFLVDRWRWWRLGTLFASTSVFSWRCFVLKITQNIARAFAKSGGGVGLLFTSTSSILIDPRWFRDLFLATSTSVLSSRSLICHRHQSSVTSLHGWILRNLPSPHG